MTKDKSRIQSCVDHINTALDVDPWAKELVAEIGKEILKAQLSCEGTTSDCISRQAVRFIETNSDSYPEEWNDDYEKGFTDALNKVIALPPVQPYTDEQIQRMQDMEQAQLDKAFELGKLDAQEEIIRCKECRWRKDQSGSTAWLPCRALATPDDFYCERAECRERLIHKVGRNE